MTEEDFECTGGNEIEPDFCRYTLALTATVNLQYNTNANEIFVRMEFSHDIGVLD